MKTKQNSSIRASALQTTFSVTLISLSSALLAFAADAVHQSAAGPQRLRQVVAAGLRNPVVIDSSWTPTDSMTFERLFHTATLLPNGQVLVAGGQNGSDASSTAELYDAANGSWSNTGNMRMARFYQTATLLPNGQVLVAGGYNSIARIMRHAELYDPATGRWTATGRMAFERIFHTATLLPNGQVLVAGGENGSGLLGTAELYDPGSGTWTATGSLGTAREHHTATLLPSGQVLVAGGLNSSVQLSSAEVYDQATRMWTATGSMGTARAYHAATLLPNGQVLVAGGLNGSVQLSSAELYDSASFTLSAARRRVDGINAVRLTWSGATSANIDVYRDVAPPIATVPNTGSYIDSTGDTGQARYKYLVCEAGTSTCSNVTKVTFPP
jgi:WD40 repeat protein